MFLLQVSNEPNSVSSALLQPDYDVVSDWTPIILLGEADGDNYYCCGTLEADDEDVSCAYERIPFKLDDAQVMFGHAALENATLAAGAATTTVTATSSSTQAPASDSCEDDGEDIGLGVGVPLGVTALLALGWGLLERRRRVNALPPAGGAWNMQSETEPVEPTDGKPHGLGRVVTATLKTVTWRSGN